MILNVMHQYLNQKILDAEIIMIINIYIALFFEVTQEMSHVYNITPLYNVKNILGHLSKRVLIIN